MGDVWRKRGETRDLRRVRMTEANSYLIATASAAVRSSRVSNVGGETG